ncbi:PEP-CTERM protein-sorting domain-containing protein [Chryseobacterium flavum]
MVQIILPVVFLLFGFFLKKTNHEGFRSSKKFANMFIILGISTLVARFILMYLKTK